MKALKGLIRKDIKANELKWSENIYKCVRQKYMNLKTGTKSIGRIENIVKKLCHKETDHFAIINGRYNPEETVLVYIIDHNDRLEELVQDNLMYGTICCIQMIEGDPNSYCTYLVFAKDIERK